MSKSNIYLITVHLILEAHTAYQNVHWRIRIQKPSLQYSHPPFQSLYFTFEREHGYSSCRSILATFLALCKLYLSCYHWRNAVQRLFDNNHTLLIHVVCQHSGNPLCTDPWVGKKLSWTASIAMVPRRLSRDFAVVIHLSNVMSDSTCLAVFTTADDLPVQSLSLFPFSIWHCH